MMIESKIIKALQSYVVQAVGKTIPVKYLNVNMKPNDKFWEIVYIPNNVQNEFWGEGKTYKGIFRLVLHWPQDNIGIYKPMKEVEKIADKFPKGLELFEDDIKVVLTDNPDLQTVIEDEGKLLIPLTIRYLCFKL